MKFLHATSGVKSFAPDSPIPPPRRGGRKSTGATDKMASSRLRFRARIVWGNPNDSRIAREELVTFGDPRRLLDFVGRVASTPDRPVRSLTLEVIEAPRWRACSVAFIRTCAAEREARTARLGGAR